MSQVQVSVAIIGLGAVAEAHIAAYQNLSIVKIVAVVDPRRERTAEVAQRLGAAGFASCEEMLQAIKPQVACVLSTVATHRIITEALARAGVHVLCEKPMTTNLEDAQAMQQICAQHNVQFMYGSSYRYLPAVRLARDLIAQGEIGTVLTMEEKCVGGKGLDQYKPMSEAHYPVGTPGGGAMGLVDHGIHLFDIFPWLINSPIRKVMGRGDRTGEPSATEFAVFEHLNGAISTVLYEERTFSSDMPWEGVFSMGRTWKDGLGFAGLPGEWTPGAGSLRIHGTRGALRVFHYPNKLFMSTAAGVREIAVPDSAAPVHFEHQLQAFLQAIKNREPSPVPVQVGIDAVKTLLAVYQSQQTQSWVALG
jgi:predicted dehydrogenase